MVFLLSSIIGIFLFTGTAHAQNTVFSTSAFTDVSASHQNYEAIEYLRTQNVVRGYIDGTFRPDIRINRAEFVEFIINPFIMDTNAKGDCIRREAQDNVATVSFSDVAKDAWYAENVCFAKAADIIDGYPDGSFHPERDISFVEAAKIITNVFSVDVSAYQSGEFWYREYVQSLSDHYAIPLGIVRFSQPITRGEMAEIVYRLKTDSTGKAGMGFNRAGNTLFVRAAVTQPVEPTPEPVVENTYSRPSRRSIIEEAIRNNALRNAN